MVLLSKKKNEIPTTTEPIHTIFNDENLANMFTT